MIHTRRGWKYVDVKWYVTLVSFVISNDPYFFGSASLKIVSTEYSWSPTIHCLLALVFESFVFSCQTASSWLLLPFSSISLLFLNFCVVSWKKFSVLVILSLLLGFSSIGVIQSSNGVCYKMKVWTDLRVRVRAEIRYSSSILLVYNKRREGTWLGSHMIWCHRPRVV